MAHGSQKIRRPPNRINIPPTPKIRKSIRSLGQKIHPLPPLVYRTQSAVAFPLAATFVSIWWDYRRGDISYNDFGRSVVKKTGRVAGMSYGWGLGSVAGAWAGACGGPLIWITEPVGYYGGGLLGSVAGYFVGNRAADYLFGENDADATAEFELEFLAMPFPG